MKTLRLMVVSTIFAGLLAVSAMAQAPSGKIGLVNLGALGDKGGITKYVNALNKLEAEFKKDAEDLNAMAKTIATKKKEFQTLREQAAKPNSPISRDTLITKASEIDKMERDAKFKQEDLQVRYGTRQQVIIGPIFGDMMKVLQEYANKKGYALILDGVKLQQQNMLMAFDSKYDITKDFIAYYNARPAGSATK